MAQEFKTKSVSKANIEVVEQVAKDISADLGIPISFNDAQPIMASAYFELKKIKRLRKTEAEGGK